jgi:hypothetical protein
MRAQWIRGVVAGSVVALFPAVAFAQGAQPVQVVPVTPAGPAVIVPFTPAGRTVPGTPAPQVPPAQGGQVQTPPAAPVSYYPVTPATARKLELSFANGRVNLVAENVTVSEILAEWSRRGGTVIDNANQLAGGPVSFMFQNQPELEVIQALLRPYAGCIIAPRMPSSPIASAFSRINIVARSTATSAPFVGAPAGPAYAQPRPDDELPPVMPPGFVPPARIPQGPPTPPPGPLTQPSAGQSSPTPGVQVAPVQPGQII